MVATAKREKSSGKAMTTRDVAEHFGITPGQVLREIRLKRLKAKRFGWVYVIKASDLPESWPPGGED